MPRLTGGQAIAKSLRAHGVDTLYALPGVQLDALFNALYDEGGAIRVLHTRHEQGAAYMALGHAMATGGVGAYAVVPGPGVLNTLAALATAYAVDARVLCVTGQVPAPHIGRGLGLLHEIPDQLGTLRGLTKWAARIEHTGEAPERVTQAFHELSHGRPRPVALEMAWDRLFEQAEVTLPEPRAEDSRPAVDGEAIASAAELLAGARRPVIVAGGGVAGAAAELRAVAEHLQAPVLANRGGRGALPADHPLAFTAAAGPRLWKDADVVLAVGTRFTHAVMEWGTDEALQVVNINLDPNDMQRLVTPAVRVTADAQAALAALAPELARRCEPRPSRAEELAPVHTEVRAELEAAVGPQIAWMDALRAALPREGVLVDEFTQVGYVGRLAWPVYAPRTYITTGYQGTLGAGYATALGVKAARPGAPVLSINGDGGFMYNVQELATAVQHKLGVVAVVFNDNAFGNVKRMQQELYEGRVIGADLHNPDFVRLAQDFGAAGYRAETPEALRATVAEALQKDEPALVEVPVGPMPDPWKLVHSGHVRGPKAR